ncbi:MAG TPA: glycosyltransferase family 2 protein, partial [Candidatus Nitrosotenuis sp.]|nr:glycosyltransferase family 2 protein [Candidatus Nitrosotenuis sp.]
SIIGCLHLDWPKDKLKVWVLDDGKRDWLQEYCQKKGAGYIRRHYNIHAKAGNLNHASDLTDGKFIAVFDADFVPYRQFLYRTIGFFSDPKVGIVQTPQAFFNKDFYQANLHLYDSTPDDQRIFFDVMMPARDAWNSAFWCGSCSVTRREAIEQVGGIPTHSVTEDLTTTLAMLRHNYVTRYLGEKLSHGLAPESLEGLKAQRERWGQGTIQAMYSKEGPFGPGLTLMQRILFFPVHWVFSPIGRLMSFVVPIVYLYTGIPALVIQHYSQIFNYHMPFIIINFFTLLWLAPRHYIPFLSTAILSLSSIQIIPHILKSLFVPWGKRGGIFNVTPKGSGKRRRGVHIYSIVISSLIFLLTFGGLYIAVFTDFNLGVHRGFFPIAAFWSSVNLILAGIMILLCFEHPRWRVDERFKINENHILNLDGQQVTAYIIDMSLGGFSMVLSQKVNILNIQKKYLWIKEVGSLPFVIVWQKGKEFHCKFDSLNEEVHDQLIRHIYTGRYDNGTVFKSHKDWIRDLWNRAFGRHDQMYQPRRKS